MRATNEEPQVEVLVAPSIISKKIESFFSSGTVLISAIQAEMSLKNEWVGWQVAGIVNFEGKVCLCESGWVSLKVCGLSWLSITCPSTEPQF